MSTTFTWIRISYDSLSLFFWKSGGFYLLAVAFTLVHRFFNCSALFHQKALLPARLGIPFAAPTIVDCHSIAVTMLFACCFAVCVALVVWVVVSLQTCNLTLRLTIPSLFT